MCPLYVYTCSLITKDLSILNLYSQLSIIKRTKYRNDEEELPDLSCFPVTCLPAILLSGALFDAFFPLQILHNIQIIVIIVKFCTTFAITVVASLCLNELLAFWHTTNGLVTSDSEFVNF